MKMPYLLKSVSLLGCLMIFFLCLNSCGSDDEGDSPCSDPSFQSDVMPILNSSCAISGCHVAGFDFGDYSDYAGVKAQADNGSLVREITNKTMPPSNTTGPSELTDSQISLIECWVEKGALDN